MKEEEWKMRMRNEEEGGMLMLLDKMGVWGLRMMKMEEENDVGVLKRMDDVGMMREVGFYGMEST